VREWQLAWHDAADPVYGTLWLVFLALALTLAAARWREAPPSDRRAWLGLAVGSGLLRALLATGGPGDLQLNVFFTHLGPANPPLFQALVRALGFTAVALTLAPWVAGALTPAVLHAVVRRRGGAPAEALGAGLFAALHPLLVRYAGEASTPSMAVFLGAVALLGLVAHVQTRRWSDLALYVVAGLLLAGTRPEASFLVGALALLGLVAAGGLARRPALWAAHGALLAGAFAVWRLSDEGGYAGHYLARLAPHVPLWPPDTVALNPTFTPLVGIVAIGLGAWAGLQTGGATRRWAAGLLAAMVCTGWPVAIDTLAGGSLATARYHAPTLIPAALLAGLGVDRAHAGWPGPWARHRVLTIVLVLAAAASVVPPLWSVTRPRAVDGEFRLLLRHLGALGPGTTILYTSRDAEIGFRPTAFRTPFTREMGLPEWRRWPDDAENLSGSAVWFRQAACEAAHDQPDAVGQRQRCVDALARFGGRPLAVDEVAGLGYGTDRYAADRLTIGLYRADAGPSAH
jgi:hypothetical protein